MEASQIGNILKERNDLFIEQKMDMLEIACGFEAKNKYQIYASDKEGVKTDRLMFVKEDSGCVERILCGVNRSLTLNFFEGDISNHKNVEKENAIMSMKKNFSYGWFCRPKATAIVNGKEIGQIKDPCKLCCLGLNQKVYMGESNDPTFVISGSACQMGFVCACCCDVSFDIIRCSTGKEVGRVIRPNLSLGNMCSQTNNLVIHFDDADFTVGEKSVLLAEAFLLDLQYFEHKK